MSKTALIDGDIVLYRCCWSAESSDVEVALSRIDNTIRNIKYDIASDDVEIYIGGSTNYRLSIDPTYKANRTQSKPTHFAIARDELINHYKAIVSDGVETDDMLGIQQTRYQLDSVICSIDKDLLQIPGYHWNFVKRELKLISPFDADRNFYKQVILGDATDNVPGYDGMYRALAPKFIEKLQKPIDSMTDPYDMYNYCLEIYSGDKERMDRNASLLYILKEKEVYWEPPLKRLNEEEAPDLSFDLD